MQEMWCRKGNNSTHSMQIAGVGKGKDADLGLCQDVSRTNKRDEAEWDVSLGKGAVLLNSPL